MDDEGSGRPTTADDKSCTTDRAQQRRSRDDLLALIAAEISHAGTSHSNFAEGVRQCDWDFQSSWSNERMNESRRLGASFFGTESGHENPQSNEQYFSMNRSLEMNL